MKSTLHSKTKLNSSQWEVHSVSASQCKICCRKIWCRNYLTLFKLLPKELLIRQMSADHWEFSVSAIQKNCKYLSGILFWFQVELVELNCWNTKWIYLEPKKILKCMSFSMRTNKQLFMILGVVCMIRHSSSVLPLVIDSRRSIIDLQMEVYCNGVNRENAERCSVMSNLFSAAPLWMEFLPSP